MSLPLGRIAALLLLSFAPLRAQTICHSENDGAGFGDNISMGGPNLLLGVRFTAPASFPVARIEVFTGEGSGTNSVAIWTHDAVGNKPQSLVSSGSWTMSTTNSWQGANLSAGAPLVSATVYWMVWGPISAAQASVDVPMATLGQPYRGSFDAGVNWSGPFQFSDRHWKFRLYGSCGVVLFCAGDGTLVTPCPCGNSGSAGRGCQNSAGTGGALLATAGTTSPDALVMSSSGELPTSLTIFLQGTTNVSTGAVFGDGLLCVSGNLKQLYVKNAVAGVATAPNFGAGDPSITVRSAALGDPIPSGATRLYQAYHRDPNPTFCANPPGNTWNVSSGVTVVWP